MESCLNVIRVSDSDNATRPGLAALEIDLVFGESTVTTAYASSPLKLLTPRSRGRSVWACTSSFGGGLVAGDQTRLNLRLGVGTRCYLGTQASTKVYRSRGGLPCSHETAAVLETGSILLFAPDPVQAFADSIYAQRQEFRLASDAGLILLDWFTSGRAACGERWSFSSFQSRNEVFIDGQRAFLDSLSLDPNEGELTNTHRMGRFNCLATLLVIGSPLKNIADALAAEVEVLPISKQSSLVRSASRIASGAVLRIAGEDVESVGKELHRHLACASDIVGEDPWARKW